MISRTSSILRMSMNKQVKPQFKTSKRVRRRNKDNGIKLLKNMTIRFNIGWVGEPWRITFVFYYALFRTSCGRIQVGREVLWINCVQTMMWGRCIQLVIVTSSWVRMTMELVLGSRLPTWSTVASRWWRLSDPWALVLTWEWASTQAPSVALS